MSDHTGRFFRSNPWQRLLGLLVAAALLLAVVGLLRLSNEARNVALHQPAAVEQVVRQDAGQVDANGAANAIVASANRYVLTGTQNQATITVYVRNSVGRPVVGGAVQFASTSGALAPATATTDNTGMAKTVFTPAGGVQSPATIDVSSGAAKSTVVLQIGQRALPANLMVSVNAPQLKTGASTDVMVRVTDLHGVALPKATVTLFASMGALSIASGVTDAAGQLRATFTAGAVSGQATVTGMSGSHSGVATIRIEPADPHLTAPTANFAVVPTSGVAPLSVQFVNDSSGAITTWKWDFGDQKSGGVRNPVHLYSIAGTYTVTLTVTGPGGTNTKQIREIIKVAPSVNCSVCLFLPVIQH